MPTVPFDLERIFLAVSVVTAVLVTLTGLITGLKSGVVRRIKIAGLTIEGGITPEDIEYINDAIINSDRESDKTEERPFEVVALSNYYNHALRRANASFWFSIVFGSIGFGVIILSFATHSPGDLWGTIIKTASGTIIDAVASIFFVQSTNAQKSMAEFFEKLRLDRLNAEARSLISEIENIERRDQLRAQLVLKYAGIDRLLAG